MLHGRPAAGEAPGHSWGMVGSSLLGLTAQDTVVRQVGGRRGQSSDIKLH